MAIVNSYVKLPESKWNPFSKILMQSTDELNLSSFLFDFYKAQLWRVGSPKYVG